MPLSKKRTIRSDDSDLSAGDDDSQGAPIVKKKARTGGSSPSRSNRDANGDPYWEIADRRRVAVSSFKGVTMVSVREYYEKDGQVLPGKKGISMPISQFAALIKVLPAIDEALREKGEQLPRPNYGASSTALDKEAKTDGTETKRNFEETSEED